MNQVFLLYVNDISFCRAKYLQSYPMPGILGRGRAVRPVRTRVGEYDG